MNKKTVVTPCNKADCKYNQTPIKNAILSSGRHIKTSHQNRGIRQEIFVEGSPVNTKLSRKKEFVPGFKQYNRFNNLGKFLGNYKK